MVQDALKASAPASVNLIMHEDLEGMRQASKYQGMQAEISILGQQMCVCVLASSRSRCLIYSGPGAKTSRADRRDALSQNDDRPTLPRCQSKSAQGVWNVQKLNEVDIAIAFFCDPLRAKVRSAVAEAPRLALPMLKHQQSAQQQTGS